MYAEPVLKRFNNPTSRQDHDSELRDSSGSDIPKQLVSLWEALVEDGAKERTKELLERVEALQVKNKLLRDVPRHGKLIAFSLVNRIANQVKSDSRVSATTLYQISGGCPSEPSARFSFHRKILVEAAFPCVPQTGVVSYAFVEALTACCCGISKSKMQ